jgi:DNA-binding beta-propeller fold protein YncE
VKKAFRILSLIGIILASVSVSVLLYFALPGTPSRSRFVTFDGYIDLPKGGSLDVLDYLTLRDRTLFVTDESSGAVFKINLDPNTQMARGEVSQLAGTGSAHGVALLSEQSIAFVTRSGKNAVDVFDPANLQALGSIPVAEDADAILYDPSNKLVYVANGDAKLATLIDPDKCKPIGTIPLPGNPEYPALDMKTGLLYQNLTDVNSVAAIDLAQRSVVGQWPLAPCEGPTGMAIDAEQRRLFAVCSRNATLVVFDLERHQIIASVGIGGGPDSVAFDSVYHRIYSAGRSGRLSVVHQDSPDAYHLLEEISTHYGAHTLVLDPVTHRVFVGYASLFNHPRIAVFSPSMSASSSNPFSVAVASAIPSLRGDDWEPDSPRGKRGLALSAIYGIIRPLGLCCRSSASVVV